jgi:hypothetical protein
LEDGFRVFLTVLAVAGANRYLNKVGGWS